MSQAEGRESREPDNAEGIDRATKQESADKSQSAELASTAAQSILERMSTPPENVPTATSKAPSSRAAASDGNVSVSPEPLLNLNTGMPHDFQEEGLPWETAPACQASVAAAQEEEPWQQVKKSQRKAVTQQAASKASARKARKQGKRAPDQDRPDASASNLQRAVQQSMMALPKSEKASAVPPHAQSTPVPGKDSAHWPALTRGKPQQPSQHDQGFQQLPGSQARPSSRQHDPLQTLTSSVATEEAHVATQRTPSSDNYPGSSLHEQVCIYLHSVSLQHVICPCQSAMAALISLLPQMPLQSVFIEPSLCRLCML